MIIFDLETTGLPKAEGSDLNMQPRIIEFGAIRVTDGNLEEYDRLEFFCNPGHPLDPVITKITGITDGMLKEDCLLYTSPSPRDGLLSRMPSSA